jgi:hypothetical protein
MPRQLSADESQPIIAHGPAAEFVPDALIAELDSASVPASSEFTSALYSADGYYDVVVGLESTQAGAINLLRFIDDAGTVPLDAAAPTQALTASTPAALVVTDGKPFASFKIEVTNTGASNAALSNVAALTAAH